ncbi:hypothetical protein GMSM_31080 [Geomonas sp. Red276]
MKRQLLLGGVLLLAGAAVCHADWLSDTIQGAGKRLGNRAVNDAGNSAYDSAKGAVKGDKSKAPNAKQTQGGSPQGGQQQSAAPLPADISIEEAERVLTKFDFVPGDQMIFHDDFAETEVGEFPRKWTLDGPKPGNNNTVDVVEYQGKHFLRSVPGTGGMPPATQYLRLDQKGDFPEKFTIEFDAVLSSVNNSPVYYVMYKVLFVPADKKIDLWRRSSPAALQISGQDNVSANTMTKVKLNDGKVHHVSISVNGTFVKAYVDNQRVINDPDGVKRPIKQLGLQMSTPNNFKAENVMFTNFRLAAGGKEIKSALDTDGRIVTHGILFDTGKSTIKGESLPTLKMILGLLNDDPELKFSIEGHTDNQGNKKINQPLSEERAAAVRSWLEGKGIDSGRLKTAGFGDSKPIDSNKTPEGRANNRRVEFVKF